MRKKIIVLVSSDLVSDQRVLKECHSLHSIGYDIEVHCRRLRQSLPLPSLPFRVKTMHLFSETGFMMFVHMNLVLFFRLLFLKAPIVWSNDLDTLLPAYLTSWLYNRKLVYDSHEYYTETPSLVNRPLKRGIWLRVEKFCLSGMRFMVTVNESIRNVYKKNYGIDASVLLNVPIYAVTQPIEPAVLNYGTKRILLLQGAGLHKDRGSEEAVRSMKYLSDQYLLLVVGSGDAIGSLKQWTFDNDLSKKVIFVGLKPYKEMMQYTKAAHLGLAFEKIALGAGSQYTLPNKLFDFIHAGLPILSSRALEIERIIVQQDIGTFIDNHAPEHIAAVIDSVFEQPEILARWKRNCVQAASQYSWEAQEDTIVTLMTAVEGGSSWRK